MSDSLDSVSQRALHTVFLDRDGVLNRKMPEGEYVTSWKQFEVFPGVLGAIRKLNLSDLRVIVVSNQRGIALGLYQTSDVEDIHEQFQKRLDENGAHVDAFYYCPHNKDECNCRKPLPGLFEQAVAKFPDITAKTSLMVGDSLSDIEFGRRLGMLTAFIEGDLESRKPNAEAAASLADFQFSSLEETVDTLLSGKLGIHIGI